MIWALGGAPENTIKICRIDLPEKMYKMLSGRLVKASRQVESVKRLPKKGYTKQLDAALLKKLVTLGQEKALPENGMKLSITKAMIRLISVMDNGSLKFEAQVGGSKKSATFLFAVQLHQVRIQRPRLRKILSQGFYIHTPPTMP